MTTSRNSSRKNIIIMLVVYLAVAGIIIGFPYHKTYRVPWNAPVLTVGDTVITMREFLKRYRLALNKGTRDKNMAAVSLLGDLQKKELIRQELLAQNITVTRSEVKEEVRRRVMESATGEGEFEDVYASLLRGVLLGKEDFEKIVKADLYEAKLFWAFQQNIPDTSLQAHIFSIKTGNAAEAEAIRRRIQAGADFDRIARTESIDLELAQKGGDMGWFSTGISNFTAIGQVHAKGVLVKTREEAEGIRKEILEGIDLGELAAAFSLDEASAQNNGYIGWVSTDFETGKQFAAESYDLSPGEISEPIDTQEGFWVIKVLEKSPEGPVMDRITTELEINGITRPIKTKSGIYLFTVKKRDPRHLLTRVQKETLSTKAMEEWIRQKVKEESEAGRIKWSWGMHKMNWALDHLE